MLGVVLVEDGRGEELRGARERCSVGGGLHRRQLSGLAEAAEQRLQFVGAHGLVEGDADRVLVDDAEIDLFGVGCGMDARRGHVGDGQRVEDRLRVDLGAEGLEAGGERIGEQLDPARDPPEALGAVVHRVHRRHDGEEDLGGADVGRGLVAADVLLARAEREAHGRIALGILGDADEAAGHLALEGIASGEEAGVGSAEAERYAEALG